MFKQSPRRNQRNRGFKVKHVLQLCLLLGVCIWLLYQVQHSRDRKASFQENAKVSEKLEDGITTIKLGRKDLLPKTDEEDTENEKLKGEEAGEINHVDDENKHEDGGLDQENTGEGVESSENSVNGVKETEEGTENEMNGVKETEEGIENETKEEIGEMESNTEIEDNGGKQNEDTENNDHKINGEETENSDKINSEEMENSDKISSEEKENSMEESEGSKEESGENSEETKEKDGDEKTKLDQALEEGKVDNSENGAKIEETVNEVIDREKVTSEEDNKDQKSEETAEDSKTKSEETKEEIERKERSEEEQQSLTEDSRVEKMEVKHGEGEYDSNEKASEKGSGKIYGDDTKAQEDNIIVNEPKVGPTEHPSPSSSSIHVEANESDEGVKEGSSKVENFSNDTAQKTENATDTENGSAISNGEEISENKEQTKSEDSIINDGNQNVLKSDDLNNGMIGNGTITQGEEQNNASSVDMRTDNDKHHQQDNDDSVQTQKEQIEKIPSLTTENPETSNGDQKASLDSTVDPAAEDPQNADSKATEVIKTKSDTSSENESNISTEQHNFDNGSEKHGEMNSYSDSNGASQDKSKSENSSDTSVTHIEDASPGSETDAETSKQDGADSSTFSIPQGEKEARTALDTLPDSGLEGTNRDGDAIA